MNGEAVWKSDGDVVQVYEETEYDLHKLLKLHKIVKELGMEEHDIIKVLELARNNQLEYLQWKALNKY